MGGGAEGPARRIVAAHLLGVLAVGAVARLALIDRLPQGAYVDEVFTLRNTLALLHEPFAPFGQTPLIGAGWVETPNVYLYFNALIVRLFGVGYTQLKLFSAVPGIAACGFFYLACTRLFPAGVAAATALLFAVAHWHVRLSRYGWDNAFLVMTFAAALWLLLLALERRPAFSLVAGAAAGGTLYGYLAGRAALGSLALALALAAARSRSREDLRRLGAFVAGAAAVAAPLALHWALHPGTASVRTSELSILGGPQPLADLAANLWRHALMFHVRGGAYARDNFPGAPMLDPLTGLLLLAGLAAAFRRRREGGWAALLPLLLLVNFAGGVFSASQEGPPYVYRVTATVVPAVLLAGFGLEWLAGAPTRRIRAPVHRQAALAALLAAAAGLNLWGYFALETRNVSAARVMGAEHRLIGAAVRATSNPVYLLLPGVLRKPADAPAPGERHFAVNRNFPYEIFGPEISHLAVLYFSGRYDWRRTMTANIGDARIFQLLANALPARLPLPATVVFHPDDLPAVELLRERHSGDAVRMERLRGPGGWTQLGVLTITAAAGGSP